MAHRFASQTTPVSRGAPASASSGAAGAPAPDARRDRSPGLVVGLGDPVSDILVRLDDADLARRVFAKCGIDEPGGCLPVDSDADIQRLLTACGDEWVDGAGVPTATADEEEDSCEPSFCPGGSAANVCKGIANLSLGCDAAFVGMIGRDDVGRRYQSLLAAQNVRPVLLTTAPDDDVSSAQCLSLVERGGQRTMRTFLGASLRMQAGDFPADEAFGDKPRLLHVEGYTLYRPALAKQAMREAKQRGALVSLDLASFEVVRNCRDALVEILNEGHVDLLFANEDEAAELLRGDSDSEEGRAFQERRSSGEDEDDKETFSRRDADDAMRWMLRHCSFATVSLGARGCVSMDKAGSRGVAPGVRVPVVDTTGAGDAFTAGYLAAFLNGASPQACASAGCAVGTAAVQVLGAELSFAKWAELRSVVLGVVERDGEFRRVSTTGADGEDEVGSRASHERAANEGASVEASVGA
jgi:sugar/nucleoside kinase (ribokinase family)